MSRLFGALALLEQAGYHLPPEKYERAIAYSHWRYALHFLTIFWTVAVLAAILKYCIAPLLRTRVEHVTRSALSQAFLFVPALLLAIDLPRLPLDLFGHWLERHYDQSVQGWISWLADWTKGELLQFLIAPVLAWILYAQIRRSPRRWWFHFWLAAMPILVFVLFIEPVVVEPLFFKFEPLMSKRPELVDAIEKIVQRGGLAIPPDRIYLMNASSKLNSLNAYVVGIGASKRVVVWDTTLAKMTPAQTLFVFGHEMGHYVLGHILKGTIFTAALLLAAMFIAYRAARWALPRWGGQWEIRGIEDWASLPLLLLIFIALAFIAEPLINGVSRYFEHQADVYGIEVTFGAIPPAPITGTEVFQILGETSLTEPNPNPFIKFWLFSHPSIADRIKFVQHYDPWSHNETRYVH